MREQKCLPSVSLTSNQIVQMEPHFYPRMSDAQNKFYEKNIKMEQLHIKTLF